MGREGAGNAHSRVGSCPGMFLRVTLAIVDVRRSVRVNHRRGSASLGGLRAHAMGEGGRKGRASGRNGVCGRRGLGLRMGGGSGEDDAGCWS